MSSKQFTNFRLKTKAEIQLMKDGGTILVEILNELKNSVKIGQTTAEIDILTKKLLNKYHVTSAFYGYRGFPAQLCISVNDEVVHGIPGDRIIADGDLISLDLGINYRNLITDSCLTLTAGSQNEADQKLISVTKAAIRAALGQIRNGVKTGDLGAAIENEVNKTGLEVVHDLSGHGVGYQLHEAPNIPNFGQAGQGAVLPAGLTIAIEPMAVAGSRAVKLSKNNWTFTTVDGGRSAHFEVTIAILDQGYLMLTPGIID